ncbi:MAG: response regulator transcription factor, partial [Hyphomicrobiaceae bacterium]
RESYSIPIFSGMGEYWSLAALRYDDNPNTDELDRRTLGELYWLTANLADFCANQLNWRTEGLKQAKRPLAPRELDCLYWAGQGKSALETAELLEIRPETVRKYLKLAIGKLNAGNKTQAVCIAHRLGYIPLV